MYGGSQHCTGGSDQSHLQEKEMQEGKMFIILSSKFIKDYIIDT